MGDPGSARTKRARWMIVLAAAVALAALAAIGVWRVLGTSGDGEGIAVVTVRDDGQLLISDLDGEEIDTLDTGYHQLGEVAVRGRYAIAHHESTIQREAMIVDLVASEPVWEGDLPDGYELAWVPDSSAPVAVSRGTRERGSTMVIDATTGEEHQLGIPGFSEQSVHASPDGRWIAVSYVNDAVPAVSAVDLDGGSDELREARFETITNDTLAISDLAGVFTLHDRDGAARGSGPLDVGQPGSRIQVLAVTGQDTVVGIHAADGATTVWESTIGAEQPTELARIDTGEEQETSGVVVQPDIGRLVVPSSGGESTILDLAGDVISAVPGALIQHNPEDVDRHRRRCFATVDSDTIRLFDLADGSLLASGSASSPGASSGLRPASTDGCTVAAGRTVLTRSGAHGLPDPDELQPVQSVAPDGSFVLTSDGQRSEVFELADLGAGPVEVDGAAAGITLR